jgi:hypothetical protein
MYGFGYVILVYWSEFCVSFDGCVHVFSVCAFFSGISY